MYYSYSGIDLFSKSADPAMTPNQYFGQTVTNYFETRTLILLADLCKLLP